ncbi:WD40 repeat domain-containing protein [Hamadaea tsunoensis]|uniref:hypothetical protein n=1 Tax=Hamadaea tsunoensis TaxID=53368 RepID=UPI00040DE803|nr:hypothetical protein [Hamadaea tsunoensis]
MTGVDRLLRTTISDLAGEMPGPTDALADAAVARGHRLRRRNRLAVAALAVVAVAAIAVPFAVLRSHAGPSAQPGSTGAAGFDGPVVLSGGWLVVGAGDAVLDRTADRYRAVRHNPGEAVLPAPAGGRVMLDGTPDGLRFVDVDGTGAVSVPIAGMRGDYRWSPDGTRVVSGISQKEPFRIGFAVIDTRTGHVSTHWIDHTTYDCSECLYTWTRDGKEVVLAIADRSGGEGAELVQRLQLFDAATGRPTRSLPVRATPASAYSWSPDGRYVIANADLTKSRFQLIEVATGTARSFPYDAVWATDDQLLATTGNRVIELTPDGKVFQELSLRLGGGRGPLTVGPPD